MIDRVTEARERLRQAIADAERDEQAQAIRGRSPLHERMNGLVTAHNATVRANHANLDSIERFHEQVRDAFRAERQRTRTLAEALFVVLGRVQYLEQHLAAYLPVENDDELTVSPWVTEWHAATDPDDAEAILLANLPQREPDALEEKIWSVAA